MSKKVNKQIAKILLITGAFGLYAALSFLPASFNRVDARAELEKTTNGLNAPEKSPGLSSVGTAAEGDDSFNQQEALAKLREQIKGREKEPAGQVFKNIQMLKEIPAGRLLAVMEMGYSRSLGVNCTHCHVPEKWEVEDKATKQIAREMSAMAASINNQLLKNIKNLRSPNPVVNCTTCHRGEIKPALNLPAPVSPTPK